MPNPVFLADLRAGHRENLLDKIERLLADGGLDEIVARDDLVAVKVHFGERGSHGYVRPVFLR
ncbi:MAG: 4Fe-4S ferredoxin, partial [Thermodesulfobacteriota bacterium]|nr:4Fe-4S ferredoxin [Thermodesulfobacteriota bacterium]